MSITKKTNLNWLVFLNKKIKYFYKLEYKNNFQQNPHFDTF